MLEQGTPVLFHHGTHSLAGIVADLVVYADLKG